MGILFQMWRRLSSLVSARSGNAAMAFAMALAPLMAAVGGGVDVSRIYSLRDRLQRDLDQSVLTGAQSDANNWAGVAQSAFLAMVAREEIPTPITSFGKLSSTRYSGKASAKLSTVFGPFIGVDEVTINVETQVEKPKAPDLASGPCIYALDKTAAPGFLANSGATVNAPKCEINVKSTGNPAAIFNGSSSIVTSRICIEGSKIVDNNGIHPNLSTSCPAADDPYTNTWQAPTSLSCSFSNGNYNGGSIALNPGVYCGWFNFNGAPDVRFAPGVYVIKGGGWNVNGGTWVGEGVTFYFADSSKIQFNSAVKTKLSAPTDGLYKGLLFGEAAGLATSDFVFNTSLGHDLTGVMHLPSRKMILNAGVDVTSDHLALVVDTLILNSMSWNVAPYNPNSVSVIPSGQAYLVR